MSPAGDRFAIMSADRVVRVFAFESGKVVRVYDESLATYSAAQKDVANTHRLDAIDFGRRLAIERDIDQDVRDGKRTALGALTFDESGHFLLYPTLIGVKCVNVDTNALACVLGRVETGVRCTAIALYQGRATKERGGGCVAMPSLADARSSRQHSQS